MPSGVLDLKVRRVNMEDLTSIVEIERTSFDEPYPPEYLEMLMGFRQGTFVVAERAGAVIGYAVASIRGVGGHILSIAVSPEERRKGVGRRLMEEIVKELRLRGVSAITLETKRGNPALYLYKSLGFKSVGIIPRYYRDGTDAISMELELD
jgi:ribosomal-protein-alanine N-acetyltransferase